MLSGMLLAVTAHPVVTNLPGSGVLQGLVNGAQGWALTLALVGLFIGATVWAIATHGHNPHHAGQGRTAALVSAAAALAIGAGPGLVNFFSNLGTHIR
jgi:Family of unknown function (DUF6112)